MIGPIWLVGAGNMGGAMLRGWLASGIDPAGITVIDPFAADLPGGVTVVSEFPRDGAPDCLVLAVKPQQLDSVTASFAGRAAPPRLLLSVLAGVETDALTRGFGAQHVIRAMPNLPASIGEGVTVLFSAGDDGAIRAEAATLARPLGLIEWISEERLFDAVTALSGSGPGYVFRFIEALAEAGAALGLDEGLARRLAIATARGSALLAERSDVSPAELADMVASPGGTTREGLNVLDEAAGIKPLLLRTLQAAARRSAELAATSRR